MTAAIWGAVLDAPFPIAGTPLGMGHGYNQDCLVFLSEYYSGRKPILYKLSCAYRKRWETLPLIPLGLRV